ncbi:MAG: helix-turn-helix domain-containing protein [Chloroflexi bacterium]|nr:helix-turn-helix domain-containing protein [Chloroflexota bacterium]
MRKRRLDLKLFQADVAHKLGVPECSVLNWEKNRTSPTLHFIPRIVEFLGYVPGDIMHDASFGGKKVAARKLPHRSWSAVPRPPS